MFLPNETYKQKYEISSIINLILKLTYEVHIFVEGKVTLLTKRGPR